VVAVEVPDKPGGLHELLEILNAKSINVEYMYAFVTQSGKNALMIFRFDRTDQAIETLKEAGLHIVPGKELYHM
jgi:hypothetical protein